MSMSVDGYKLRGKLKKRLMAEITSEAEGWKKNSMSAERNMNKLRLGITTSIKNYIKILLI